MTTCPRCKEPVDGSLAVESGRPMCFECIVELRKEAVWSDNLCVVCHAPIEPAPRYFTSAGGPRHMLCNDEPRFGQGLPPAGGWKRHMVADSTEYSPEFQDEYRRLWHETAAELRKLKDKS